MIREIFKSFVGYKVARPNSGEIALRITDDNESVVEQGDTVFVESEDRLLVGPAEEIQRIRDALRFDPEEGKVSLNTGHFDELRNIKHINVERAHEIIDRRPWESIEDLINITGIGKVAMQDIRRQNIVTI